MVSESPEGELSHISHSLSLTSRWSCFTSLSRLPASSIIERAAGRVNTILKHAHYVPLKLTHTHTHRHSTCVQWIRHVARSLPPQRRTDDPHYFASCWQAADHNKLGLARCGPLTMTGMYRQIFRDALDCVERAFLRSFSVRLSAQNRMKICSSWKRKKKTKNCPPTDRLGEKKRKR